MPDQQKSSQAAFTEPDEDEVLLDRESDWPTESDDLPRRPRQKLLTPLPLTLLAVLLIACGFIAGVLVQKGQSSSTGGGSGTAGFAARFAAARGAGTASGGSATPAAGAAPTDAAGLFASGSTVGQVAFVKGSTLYVTDTQGNTVKVKAPASATVSKTVSSSVKAIHPGETVLVTGTTSADGTVAARSIRVGVVAGGLGGTLPGAGSSPSSATSNGGEPSLFGKG